MIVWLRYCQYLQRYVPGNRLLSPSPGCPRVALLQSGHSKWAHLTPCRIGDSRDDTAQVRRGAGSGVHLCVCMRPCVCVCPVRLTSVVRTVLSSMV